MFTHESQCIYVARNFNCLIETEDFRDHRQSRTV